MITLVVTGGIATGKSSFCQAWREIEPASIVHDADQAVHALYGSPEVRALLSRAFGPEILLGDSDVDRSMIRRAIAHDPGKKLQLEEILHPRVRSGRADAIAEARASGCPWFLAEIPVFFEAGAVKPEAGSPVIVVACAPETQRQRLQQRNPFDNAEAGRMIGMQLDLSAKMAAADHVLWNEGPPATMLQQARMLRDCLLSGALPSR
jgi:dephospho-CoA kinase